MSLRNINYAVIKFWKLFHNLREWIERANKWRSGTATEIEDEGNTRPYQSPEIYTFLCCKIHQWNIYWNFITNIKLSLPITKPPEITVTRPSPDRHRTVTRPSMDRQDRKGRQLRTYISIIEVNWCHPPYIFESANSSTECSGNFGYLRLIMNFRTFRGHKSIRKNRLTTWKELMAAEINFQTDLTVATYFSIIMTPWNDTKIWFFFVCTNLSDKATLPFPSSHVIEFKFNILYFFMFEHTHLIDEIHFPKCDFLFKQSLPAELSGLRP